MKTYLIEEKRCRFVVVMSGRKRTQCRRYGHYRTLANSLRTPFTLPGQRHYGNEIDSYSDRHSDRNADDTRRTKTTTENSA